MNKGRVELYLEKLFFSHEQTIIECQLGLATGNLADLKINAANFLHPQELEYLPSLRYEKRQHSFLISRYCAKHAVAEFNKLSNLTSFQIKSGALQQPILSGSGTKDAQISLSHCEEISSTIVFPSSLIMGIDIESVQAKFKDTLCSQMQAHELDLINSHFSTQDLLGLTLVWTCKEALSKAIKTGLTIPFDLLAIKSLESKDNFWITTFKNFNQYQALSLQLDQIILSLVYPKQFKPKFEAEKIRQWFKL